MDFLKALLNDLSYLLDDALDRIADVAGINAAMADSAAWAALSQEERRTKQHFRASQVRGCCSFGDALSWPCFARVGIAWGALSCPDHHQPFASRAWARRRMRHRSCDRGWHLGDAK